ncbi:hypothetical protein N0V95_009151 [Ascochyta clinopodiicola]|nr:hypothetical protein N0V95_009151 [Ascochyta clinopodiicola]
MSYEFDLEASDSVSDQLAVAIADILNGAIGATMAGPAAHQFDNGGAFLASAHTRIMETALIGFVSTAFDGTFGGPLAELPMADRELTKNKTLPAALEELSRNVTLSLFSSDRLWSPNVTMANVTRSEYRTIYSYQPRNLLLAYGIAIATSAIGVLLGLRALWLNGVAHDTGYFSIMATTRNRFLDDLTVGNDLGAVPIPKHIQEERLRFGVIMDAGHNSDGRELRVGFGAERQLQSLKKDLR